MLLSFFFFNNNDLINCFFSVFKTLTTCAVPCLCVYSVYKCRSNLSTNVSTSKQNWHLACRLCDCRYLICFFYLHVFHYMHDRPHFCHSLTFKCTRHSLLVSFCLLKALAIPFSFLFSLQKCKPNFSSCFNTSKYISKTLLYVFQPLKHQCYFLSSFLTIIISFTASFEFLKH